MSSERSWGIWRIMAHPWVYELVQHAVGARMWLKGFIARRVRPAAGERYLDIGCGTGDVIRYLPAVDYVGFDRSAPAIERARGRHATGARFYCDDVNNAAAYGEGNFNVVTAIGVLHHVDDAVALRLFEGARGALQPGGRFVTADPCHTVNQNRFVKFMIDLDRGQHIRRTEEYLDLCRQVFPNARAELTWWYWPYPRTICVIEASV